MIVDVAYHEGLIDWRQAKEAGVVEAYIRFATGAFRGAADPLFLLNCEGAQRQELRWSVYHVPAVADQDGVKVQSDVFGMTVNLLVSLVGLQLWYDLPPVADWEAFQAWRQSTNRAWALEYHQRLTDTIQRYPGVYTRASWWDSKMGHAPIGIEPNTFLWLAQPGPGGIPTTVDPTVPKAWKAVGKTWDLHQYTWKARIPGIPGECDANRRNLNA